MFILIAILGLSLLIFVHELGHFLAAKAFGMRAEKFYIGFPPAAVKKKYGETEYGIGVVPLGGYVKISGMNRDEELPEDVVPRAYYSKPIWQRVITITAGAAMNVLFAFLLLFIFWVQPQPVYDFPVGEIIEDSGASSAGVEVGDEIVAIDGVYFENVIDMQDTLRENPDTQVTLTVLRDGRELELPAMIGVNEDTGDGLLGVRFERVEVGTEQFSAWGAAEKAASDMAMVTGLVFVAMRDIFVDQGDQLASPIGIVAFSAETIELGWEVYLYVLGFISIQLAILNMLPLLPLDGGHVLFNVIEKVRGRPVNREAFERISFVGLMLFVVLLFVGFMNDVERIFGPGFELTP